MGEIKMDGAAVQKGEKPRPKWSQDSELSGFLLIGPP